MLRRTAAAMVVVGLTIGALPSQAASPIKVGGTCTKVGVKKTYASKKYVCTRSSGRLVWKLVAPVASQPTSTPTATPTPTPTPTSSDGLVYVKYSGTGGSSGTSSVELPSGISVTGDGNVKFWVYDPEAPTRPLGANGVFRKPSNGPWEWVALRSDGTYIGTWAPGEYSIDTVEPNGNVAKYERRAYTLRVSADKPTEVVGLTANSQGVFTFTINLRDSGPAFTPANACQLNGPAGGSTTVGFPRRSDRLTNNGVVRALIVPVSAKDLPGNGDPFELYRPMAEGVYSFYKRMSQGQVRFEFQVLNTWISLGDSARKFSLGTWSGGQPGAYYTTAINAADPYVDFSRFDVVYFMSPTNVPWDYIAYGPAFPSRFTSGDGFIKNGTISGADAYQNFPGALWKWAAHETGHLFGFYDLYTSADATPTYGSWDIMSLNWSVKAIELNAWNRFLQGWLNPDQYLCKQQADISSAGTSVSLISITSDAPGLKSLMIKLSDTKMLVIESRRTGGYDKLPSTEEGVLVYTVDMTIGSMGGGYKTQRRAGSSQPDFTDALLKAGDSVTADGYVISVVSAGTTSEVKVSRP